MSAAPPAAGALPGSDFPLGATVTDAGTNFAVALRSPTVWCCACSTRLAPRHEFACATTTPASGTPSCLESRRGKPTDSGRRVPGIRPGAHAVIRLGSYSIPMHGHCTERTLGQRVRCPPGQV